MARADFQCDVCRGVSEEEIPPPDTYFGCTAFCGEDEDGPVVCPGELHRVWTAPHLGKMSSGEPPR